MQVCCFFLFKSTRTTGVSVFLIFWPTKSFPQLCFPFLPFCLGCLHSSTEFCQFSLAGRPLLSFTLLWVSEWRSRFLFVWTILSACAFITPKFRFTFSVANFLSAVSRKSVCSQPISLSGIGFPTATGLPFAARLVVLAATVLSAGLLGRRLLTWVADAEFGFP